MQLRTYDDERVVLEVGDALAMLVYFGPDGSRAVWVLCGRLLRWLDVASC
jgi:hypothetical protein